MLTAFALTILIGFVGLVIDGGYLYSVRQRMQTAADAAAVAAANVGVGPASQVARQVAGLNGFSDGQDGVSVTVEAPSQVPRPALNQYVQVEVSQPVPTSFLRVLGYDTVTVAASAVAGSIDGPNCIYALSPAGAGVVVERGARVDASCGVVVDSIAPTALTVKAGAALRATSIGVVGGVSGAGAIVDTRGRPLRPATGIVAAADPLAALQPPRVAGCTYHGPVEWKRARGEAGGSARAGVYCGGIVIDGARVNFAPGVYVIAGGGITASPGSRLTGTDVTFYLTRGEAAGYAGVHSAYAGVSLDTAAATLSAPVNGPFKGILFFQDRSLNAASPASAFDGRANLEGALYFPTTRVAYASGARSAYTILVAGSIDFIGAATVQANYASLTRGSPIRSAALYE